MPPPRFSLLKRGREKDDDDKEKVTKKERKSGQIFLSRAQLSPSLSSNLSQEIKKDFPEGKRCVLERDLSS